ncbi:MAG: hypothetical protein ABJ013_05215 [Halioglobus sp.]
MDKDFNEFGGWLKFFYIVFWINIALCLFAIPAEVLIRLSDDPDIAQLANGFDLFEALIIGVIYWLVVQSIKTRSAAARYQVQRFGWLAVFIIFLLAALQALLSGDPFAEVFDYPNHVFLPLTFTLYLHQSKRVQTYYQLPENAESSTKVTKEESAAFAKGMVRMYSIVLLAILGIMAFSGLLIYTLS